VGKIMKNIAEGLRAGYNGIVNWGKKKARK